MYRMRCKANNKRYFYFYPLFSDSDTQLTTPAMCNHTQMKSNRLVKEDQSTTRILQKTYSPLILNRKVLLEGKLLNVKSLCKITKDTF